ncbi:MAG: hypothetical protein NVSMB5_22560 [Candidatus Velthaea sp.]
MTTNTKVEIDTAAIPGTIERVPIPHGRAPRSAALDGPELEALMEAHRAGRAIRFKEVESNALQNKLNRLRTYVRREHGVKMRYIIDKAKDTVTVWIETPIPTE